MIGSIIGDVIGSFYEHNAVKIKNFELFKNGSKFTDDTVLTIATARAILRKEDYGVHYRLLGQEFPTAGYGSKFSKWLTSNQPAYNSFGNGSAMRVSPIAYAFSDLGVILSEAKKSAEVSHNHPEGIKGAQAVAMALFLCRTGSEKESIRTTIAEKFGYNLTRTCDEIRPKYSFDSSCQGSVPESIIAFLDSNNFEEAVRNAISLGGDADTMACIAGGLAEAFYKKIPAEFVTKAFAFLPEDFIETIEDFCDRYIVTVVES